MEKEWVLLTGGAGYIGLNVAKALLEQGKNVVIVDNFSNSYKSHLDKILKENKNSLKFYNVDLRDVASTKEVFKSHLFTSVIHLAGKKYVGESFKKTKLYKENNIDATKTLLDMMTKFKIKKIVFSSSITVYGNVKGKIKEDCPLAPISPYAKQKEEGEKMICEWAEKHGGKYVILRLSNPIGAGDEGKLGEHSKSKYKGVVPYLVERAREGGSIVLNGNDHPTRDGTTIRDYVFVEDVAKAFAKAVSYCGSEIINVGTSEEGFTVLEILKEVEKVTMKKLNFSFREKQAGDVSVITTDNKKLKKLFGIIPNRDLTMLIKSHYDFVCKMNKKGE